MALCLCHPTLLFRRAWKLDDTFCKHLYEIALKVPRSKEEYYTTIFQKIITNFKIENKTLFNINDEILEERLFNLHD